MAPYLAGGDRRSIGRANEIVELLQSQPCLLPQLIQEMWNSDPIVAMRAADAVEKFTRNQGRAAALQERFAGTGGGDASAGVALASGGNAAAIAAQPC